MNVGAGSVPVPDNSTVLLLLAVLSSKVRLAVRVPLAEVTLTVNFTVVPEVKLAPAAGVVILNVGVAFATVIDSLAEAAA